MKSVKFLLLISLPFISNCSSIPEIKPYQAPELTVEDVLDRNNDDGVFDDFQPGTAISEVDAETENERNSSVAESDVLKITEIKDEAPIESIEPVLEQTKQRKTASVFKNGFYVFSKNCSMKSQPNDDSQDVGNVSAGKKLWLDGVNGEWLKAYKKAGTVYIPSDCIR